MLLAWFKTRHILLFGFRIRFSIFISLSVSPTSNIFPYYHENIVGILADIKFEIPLISSASDANLFGTHCCSICPSFYAVCVSLMVDICPTVLAVNWTAFPPRDIRFSIIHLHYGFSFSFLLFACIFRNAIIFNNYFLQLISLGGNIAIKQRTFK